MARVQFDHVYKSFNKVQVVQDINMDIKDKEFLVLVGPSGCGKSTCLYGRGPGRHNLRRDFNR